jgi:hypothetical protein
MATFGGGLVPTNLSGCILWLRGDLGVTLNGADVAAWADQSGQGNDATQGVAADQPAFEAAGGPNGTPCVTFDSGNTEFLDLTGMVDTSNAYTIFAVFDPDTNPNGASLFSSTGTGNRLLVYTSTGAAPGTLGLNDGATRIGMVCTLTPQILTWRYYASPGLDFYRDGSILDASNAHTSNADIAGTTLLGEFSGGGQHLDGKLAEIIIYNRKLTDTEVAIVHAYLSNRYAIEFSPLSVADCGAWWDLDNATQSGGVLTAVTDRALGQTINVVGSPAVVSVGSQDFVRFDGSDDVLWIADAAALDGAAGNAHAMKHANCESLPVNATMAQKGRSAVHLNGGLGGHGSAGTRFTAICNSGNDADVGPLAEFTSPAETIAMAIESGVAVRRVDGDGTYASNATAQTTTVGAGSLTWGARETGASAFDEYIEVDLRAAAYYARPLNQQELEAVRSYLDLV